MGCGTSKAAQVAEGDITIKDYPPSHHHDADPTVGVVPSSSSATATGDELSGIPHGPSSQSVIERQVHNIVTSSGSTSPRQPIMENTSQERMHDQALPSESTESLPKPVAFEVCMSSDGDSNPKGKLPKRLSKIESLPKIVTSEMLAEKQKAADDRKQKELEKRANHRMSRKERLRQEIAKAREMEGSQEQLKQLSSGVNNDERSGDTISYDDPSVEIEVDSTYNADQQTDLWESQSTQCDEVKSKMNKSDNVINEFEDLDGGNSLSEDVQLKNL